MAEYKISEEVAENSYDEMVEYYVFDIDDLPQDQKNLALLCRKKIIKAIRKGKIEIIIDDEILIRQHLKNGNPIEYKEITGKAKIQSDKKDGIYGKIHNILGSVSGLGPAFFSKLKGADMSLSECIGNTLLMV